MKARSGPVRSRLRQALRDSFARIIELCLQHDARFLLIAGDLFDADTVSLSTQDFLVDQLGRLDGIPVFIAPGNHDPYRARETYARMVFPANVHVFQSVRPEHRPVHDSTGRVVAVVHGAAHDRKNLATNLVASIEAPQDGLFHVACVHACVQSSNVAHEHDDYAPCTTDDFAGRGIGYWALGHVHRRQIVSESPCVLYPGNIQGRDLGETGPKGCYVAHVDANRHVTPTFVETSDVRWHQLDLDIEGLADIAQAGQALRERWQADAAGFPGEWCLRVRMVGRGSLHLELSGLHADVVARDDLIAQWQDALGVLLLDLQIATTPPIDLGALLDEQNIRADFIRSVLDLKQDPRARAALIESIADMPWMCPDWHRLTPEQQDDYVAERLDEALMEGVVRLSPQEDLGP